MTALSPAIVLWTFRFMDAARVADHKVAEQHIQQRFAVLPGYSKTKPVNMIVDVEGRQEQQRRDGMVQLVVSASQEPPASEGNEC